MGGKSGEHEVSLKSGAGVINNLNPTEYISCPVIISKDGKWIADSGYGGFSLELPFNAEAFLTINTNGSDTIPAFMLNPETKPDIVFPIIHGKFGEDGTLQGMLEMHGLKYTGSGVLGSSLAMHKRMAKEMYQFHKLNTPEYSYYSKRKWESGGAAIIAHIVEKLKLPLFIKNPEGGSSIGMGMAKTKEEVKSIADNLFEDSNELIFETAIKGTEVSCGVLENTKGDCEPLLPTEIVPVSSAFFDFKAKYEANASREITPARLFPPVTEAVQKAAVKAHNALHCKGFSRTDMIISNNTPYILETNTLPGFTETSLLPQGAKACGISYPELLDRIIQCAM